MFLVPIKTPQASWHKREIFKVCQFCGSFFEARLPNGASRTEKRFCDRFCSTKWIASNRRAPKRTPEWNKNIGDAQRGEKANNWQGGIYPEIDALRRRADYKNWRKKVFERDDYTCQHCEQRGGKLHADHIKSFAKYPKLRLKLSNGRTLCETCHRKTQSYARNVKHHL